MKPMTLVIAVLAFIAGATLTFLVIRVIGAGNPGLSFIVGAILGTNVGAVVHHRQPGSKNTMQAKAVLGVVLAVSAVLIGIILHQATRPFKFVEISLLFAAIGSFVFPFVLMNTMWHALSKARPEPDRESER